MQGSEKAVREALLVLHMDPDIEHVTDFAKIAAGGAMRAPALVVDGQMLPSGRV